MRNITIHTALSSLRPKSRWTAYGTEYENVQWQDNVQSIPTKEEVLAEVARLQAEYDAAEYQRMRSPEYPPLQDLADALYWQAQGNNEPMSRYLEACAAVKNKYPKGGTNA